jgi:hypothetical protein
MRSFAYESQPLAVVPIQVVNEGLVEVTGNFECGFAVIGLQAVESDDIGSKRCNEMAGHFDLPKTKQ